MKKGLEMNITDSELIIRMQKGDTGAFSILYHRHAPKLLNFVTGLIKDPAAAEDIIQNVFIKLWSGKGQLDSSKSLTSWLFVCARNESLNVLKSRRHFSLRCEEFLQAATYNTEEAITLGDMRDSLSRAVSLMPDRRREVWRLSREQHLSSAEIAERLGLSVRTVEKHIELALRQIRDGFN